MVKLQPFLLLSIANDGYISSILAQNDVQETCPPSLTSEARKTFKESVMNYERVLLDLEDKSELKDILYYTLAKVYYTQGSLLIDVTPTSSPHTSEVLFSTFSKN